jgi:hypothetical protein
MIDTACCPVRGPAICLSLVDRDKLPHADLSRALTAPLQFKVEIPNRVNTDSTPLTARYRPPSAPLASFRPSSANVQTQTSGTWVKIAVEVGPGAQAALIV